MTRSPRDVVITGVGPVTAIGTGADALWSSLAVGRTHVTQRTLRVDVARTCDLPMAVMSPDDPPPGFDRHMSALAEQGCEHHRDLAYALCAIDLALTDARLEFDRTKNNIGAIQAFEAPGVERTVARLFDLLSMAPPPGGPPAVYELLAPHFYNMQAFLYVHLLGKIAGLHGFSTSVHNACSSGAFAMEIAADRIRSGLADVMIVVGGEAFDTGVRLEWFRRLELYAGESTMRPFDRAPSGFFVGEGAGAIVLESADHARQRGARAYARYRGGSFAQQGWKQTMPDLRAARLRDVIVDAIARTSASWSTIDLIVPHGASTMLSDGYERECLNMALNGAGATQAVATAFKPYVGHMLAASGIIETIAMLLSMKNQLIPATPNTSPHSHDLPIPLASHPIARPIRHALKLSTGFTGHDAAGVFETAE